MTKKELSNKWELVLLVIFASLGECTVDPTCRGKLTCPSTPTGVTRTVGPMGQDFTSIQAAINAANSGDQILVFPGTYREQITIPAGKNNLFITSQTSQAAIITVPLVPLVGNLAIVEVQATCTQIRGFTIQGPSIQQGNLDSGIRVTNGGSAIIENNLIQDIRDNPLSGLQLGHGIRVDVGAARIVNNTIRNYQKTGVRIENTGSCGVIENNTITGVGPTDVIAQNGILIFNGASASVQGNTVTNNIYTPESNNGVGILLFQTVGSAPVCVQFNNLSNNSMGISLNFSDGALIQGNDASNNIRYGVVTQNNSLANLFILNTALNNPIFDFFDDSVGLLSARTGNVYLCNHCNTDNKDGAICASTSPLP